MLRIGGGGGETHGIGCVSGRLFPRTVTLLEVRTLHPLATPHPCLPAHPGVSLPLVCIPPLRLCVSPCPLCRRIAKATGGRVVLTLADMEGNETFDPSALGTADEVAEIRVADDAMVSVLGGGQDGTALWALNPETALGKTL